MWELIKYIVTVMFIIFLFIMLFVFGGIYLDKISCYQQAKVYEVDAKFVYLAGCFYKYDNKFIPKEEYEKLLIPNYQMGNAEIKVKLQD